MCLAGQYARQHLEAIQSSLSPRCQCRHDPLVNRSPFLIRSVPMIFLKTTCGRSAAPMAGKAMLLMPYLSASEKQLL
jgi:hypothetical protein